jgi:L-amino acid N-acyltransferase YncA
MSSLTDKGCTFPNCECKVPDYAFSEEKRVKFCKMLAYITNPAHGGKVTCHKCNGFIKEGDVHIWRGDMNITWFHKDCYNPYEHYYGLDKPID